MHAAGATTGRSENSNTNRWVRSRLRSSCFIMGCPVLRAHGHSARSRARARVPGDHLLPVRLRPVHPGPEPNRGRYGDGLRSPDRSLGYRTLLQFRLVRRGPHALASAAVDSLRVSGALISASFAPSTAAGLDFVAGMGKQNDIQFRSLQEGDRAARAAVSQMAAAVRGNPPEHVTAQLSSLFAEARGPWPTTRGAAGEPAGCHLTRAARSPPRCGRLDSRPLPVRHELSGRTCHVLPWALSRDQELCRDVVGAPVLHEQVRQVPALVGGHHPGPVAKAFRSCRAPASGVAGSRRFCRMSTFAGPRSVICTGGSYGSEGQNAHGVMLAPAAPSRRGQRRHHRGGENGHDGFPHPVSPRKMTNGAGWG